LAILLLLPVSLHGNSVITDPVLGPIGNTAGNNTLGFDFTVGVQPIQVTALGLWDFGLGGFGYAHEVGLWNSSGVLLGSVLIPSGSAAPLDGQFRYQNLSAALTLFPGQRYVLGAHFAAGDTTDLLIVHYQGDQAIFDSAVIPGRIRYYENAGFTFPSNDGLIGSEVGPNAIFTVIPEPSVPILLLGCAALVTVSRRKAA